MCSKSSTRTKTEIASRQGPRDSSVVPKNFHVAAAAFAQRKRLLRFGPRGIFHFQKDNLQLDCRYFSLCVSMTVTPRIKRLTTIMSCMSASTVENSPPAVSLLRLTKHGRNGMVRKRFQFVRGSTILRSYDPLDDSFPMKGRRKKSNVQSLLRSIQTVDWMNSGSVSSRFCMSTNNTETSTRKVFCEDT